MEAIQALCSPDDLLSDPAVREGVEAAASLLRGYSSRNVSNPP
jgi:hypothetical protein